MGDKPDVADMVEEELRLERERANERPTIPPKETFARVLIGEEESIQPAPKKPQARRIVEQVATKRDPRRDETEPPPPPSSSDPHRAPTKPPPPGYEPEQTE